MFALTDLIMLALMTPATVYGFGEKIVGILVNRDLVLMGNYSLRGKIRSKTYNWSDYGTFKMRFKPFTVLVRSYKNECIPLRINDKSNHRWIGKRGFDLTPAAVKAITGKVHKKWSGRLEFCVETFDLFR